MLNITSPQSRYESCDLSVTRWAGELQNGDEYAASRLWQFLSSRMNRLAGKAVANCKTTSYDEDDIVNSAFAGFCQSMQSGAYDELGDRTELWKLVAVIILNKARNRVRDENRIRRGGEFKRSEMTDEVMWQIASDEADPATAMLAKDECERLLKCVDRPEVKLVALLKIEGYTNQEIAEQIGCTRRSVQRRLNLIRDVWSKEV